MSDLDHDTMLEIYRRMVRIRLFEFAVQKMAKRGELPGSIHLSLGQEGQVVGSCMPLQHGDYMTGTHRSHGHPIGKGAPLRGLMAEILGRRTGVCKGKGGSMHLADFSVGSLGESGVIGSGIPVATGAGFAAKTNRTGAVALTFFGDGGANQGVLYECLNMAALWKLPVIYLLENNMYASLTPQTEVTAQTDVFRRADAFGVRSVVVDGQDVLEVYRAVDEAVTRGRNGDGPTFVEVRTYRFSDHSEGLRFARAYEAAARKEDEVAEWKARDPLEIMRQHLRDHEIPDAEVEQLEAEVADEVADAVRFGNDSEYPDPGEAFDDLYSVPLEVAR